MKIYVLLVMYLLAFINLDAQNIRVNGDVTTKAKVPIKGVVVMAFDKSTMVKSYVTDENGEFSFYVDRVKFDILFYKPGMPWHSYGLNNKLDKEIQGINIPIVLDDSVAETSISPYAWLNRHHLTQSLIDSLYTVEINRTPPISKAQARKAQKELIKKAEAEQKRFSNFKESTVDRTVDNKDSKVTTIRVGPDKYERILNENGDKKYYKNKKPITQYTYDFETTRRYEGVLKNENKVKHFDKYEPMQHVKEDK